jgi:hypothetical protein
VTEQQNVGSINRSVESLQVWPNKKYGGKQFYVIELTVADIVDLINRSEGHYGPHLDPERAREVETADSQKIRIEVEL